MVKNLLHCERPGFKPWVRKIPPEKGMATQSSILAWKIPWTEKPGGYCAWGGKEADMTEQLTLFQVVVIIKLFGGKF